MCKLRLSWERPWLPLGSRGPAYYSSVRKIGGQTESFPILSNRKASLATVTRGSHTALSMAQVRVRISQVPCFGIVKFRHLHEHEECELDGVQPQLSRPNFGAAFPCLKSVRALFHAHLRR